MVDSAFIWISLTTLWSSIAAVAFVLHYAQAAKFDYMAFAIAVVFGGYGLELSMANGYFPDNRLFSAIVGVCVVIAVVSGALGIKRQQKGFQILRDDAR